jgi:hypothetical protein
MALNERDILRHIERALAGADALATDVRTLAHSLALHHARAAGCDDAGVQTIGRRVMGRVYAGGEDGRELVVAAGNGRYGTGAVALAQAIVQALNELDADGQPVPYKSFEEIREAQRRGGMYSA